MTVTLLIILIAACVCTVILKNSSKARTLGIGSLCLIYWGAVIMWSVDMAAAYAEKKSEFFSEIAANMMNDTLLGISVVFLGVLIWAAAYFVKGRHRTSVKNAE